MTDRRLLFTDPASGALLWELGRSDVQAVSEHRTHLRITFVDDSWVLVQSVEDKNSMVPDRDEYFATKMVKGKPTRVPLTSSTSIMFFSVLKTFVSTPPVASP